MITGRGGELKRDGGLLTFFPRKGGGALIREGGLNRGFTVCNTTFDLLFKIYFCSWTGISNKWNVTSQLWHAHLRSLSAIASSSLDKSSSSWFKSCLTFALLLSSTLSSSKINHPNARPSFISGLDCRSWSLHSYKKQQMSRSSNLSSEPKSDIKATLQIDYDPFHTYSHVKFYPSLPW